MNVPFLVRFPGKLDPRVDDLILSSPDIMPTLLGLAGLNNLIPAEVQGNNYASIFLGDKSTVKRPTGALYIQNADSEKDVDGKVVGYFPAARGFKTHDYTIALYINQNYKLVKTLLFHDKEDPYQMKNLSLEENMDIVKKLCTQMGQVLKEIDDPWYKSKVLKDIIQYE